MRLYVAETRFCRYATFQHGNSTFFFSLLNQYWNLDNDGADAEDNTYLKFIDILPVKFTIVQLFSIPIALNSKWKYEKLDVVAYVPQSTQYLIILRSCFAEDGKEMFKDF